MLKTKTPLRRKSPLKGGSAMKSRKPMKRKGKHGKKAMTADERERRNRCVGAGCVACWLNRKMPYQDAVKVCAPVAAEYHHFKDGDRRISHSHAYALCGWHHRGLPPWGMTSKSETAEKLGPSLAEDANGFHARYGDDATLLAFQNRILASIYGAE